MQTQSLIIQIQSLIIQKQSLIIQTQSLIIEIQSYDCNGHKTYVAFIKKRINFYNFDLTF